MWSFVVLFLSCVCVCVTCFALTPTIAHAHYQTGATLRVLGSCGFEPRMNPDREGASSMVTAGATANTTKGNSRASRESGLLSSHSHGESIDP